MGICMSSEEKTQKNKHMKIENQLKVDKLMEQSEIKMLLLGAGESGKSTILKQMKLLHDNGYSEDERVSFKEVVFANAIQCMKVMVDAMNRLGIFYGDFANEKYKDIINHLPYRLEAPVMPREAYTAIKALWADSGIQLCYTRSNEFQLSDSAKYFFEAIDRISEEDYVPTDIDVLRIRVKTIGVIETTFQVNNMRYKMFDVGGQRSERKKWIHCFDTVTAVIFLAAISEYDQVLIEDESMNRIKEALTLFESICNSPYFLKTAIILFLNKKDLFAKKLLVSPLNKFFEDFEGGDSYELATVFMQEKFMSLNATPSKQIYTHFTCATDVDQIKVVMQAVYDIVVQANLRECGLM